MTSKTALILATTAAIALGSFEMRPAAAAPEGGPAIVKQNAGADDFSSQRKRRRGRGVHPAVPLAAFGALVGTIGAVAAARREREYYYERPYYGAGIRILRGRAGLPVCPAAALCAPSLCAAPACVITYAPRPRGGLHPDAVPARSAAGRARPHAGQPAASSLRTRATAACKPDVSSARSGGRRCRRSRFAGPPVTLTAKMLRRKFFC